MDRERRKSLAATTERRTTMISERLRTLDEEAPPEMTFVPLPAMPENKYLVRVDDLDADLSTTQMTELGAFFEDYAEPPPPKTTEIRVRNCNLHTVDKEAVDQCTSEDPAQIKAAVDAATIVAKLAVANIRQGANGTWHIDTTPEESKGGAAAASSPPPLTSKGSVSDDVLSVMRQERESKVAARTSETPSSRRNSTAAAQEEAARLELQVEKLSAELLAAREEIVRVRAENEEILHALDSLNRAKVHFQEQLEEAYKGHPPPPSPKRP